MSALRWYSWQDELAVRHVELEERMARHERHLVELAHVPRAHDDAAGIGVAAQLLHDLRRSGRSRAPLGVGHERHCLP